MASEGRGQLAAAPEKIVGKADHQRVRPGLGPDGDEPLDMRSSVSSGSACISKVVIAAVEREIPAWQ